MTSPLDEKGLRAAMEAQVGQGCAVREYLDFTAEDAKSFGVNIVGENFAKLDVVRHQQYEDAGLAILSAAIRSYLSATALPDGLDVVAWECTDLIMGGEPGVITDVDHAAMRKLQPKAWAVEDLVRISQAQSALAAMRVERDRNATEYETVLNSYADENQRLHDRADTLEAQVKRLTEENEALRAAIATHEAVHTKLLRADLPAPDGLVERLRSRLVDYDADLWATIAAGILPDRAAYGEDVSGVTYAEISEAATVIQTLQEQINQWDAWAEGLTPAEIGNGMAKREARIKALEEALENSDQALCDWLNTYAPDMCDPARVAEAKARIGAQGTIAYIADVLQTVRAAKEGK